MLRSARDEEFEAEVPKKDVELTLGPAMLFAFVCGLLLLCGLCFGVGYTSGRRSGLSMIATTKVTASGETLAQAASNGRKPGAKGAPPTVQAATSAGAPGEPTASSGTVSGDGQVASLSEPAVRPAMGSQAATTQSGAVPASSGQVQPALAPGSGVMVQVAAVSHVEDANVLMGALRKRGYAVTARREPDDNLIHVQVGPFANRVDANIMSQRLLSDGYNAVVLP